MLLLFFLLPPRQTQARLILGPGEREQHTPRKPSMVMSDAGNNGLDIFGHLTATLKHSRRGGQKYRLPSNAIFKPLIHHEMQSWKSLSHHDVWKKSVYYLEKKHQLLAQHTLWSQVGDNALTSWSSLFQDEVLPQPEYTVLASKG